MSQTQEIEILLEQMKTLENKNAEIQTQLDWFKSVWDKYFNFAPPGHYYSPIPEISELIKSKEKIWETFPTELPGISLNKEFQLSLISEFSKYIDKINFNHSRSDDARYFSDNDFYPYTDSAILALMILHLKPKKIIEIGSGFSSAVMMDINEKYLAKSIQLTFIEPFPEERLNKLMTPDDTKRYIVNKNFIQNVDFDMFSELEENDILFIDSSHVSKIDSDLNTIIFEILPRLKKGVYVHFHDLFYPFEYPQSWIEKGVAWNEAYMLRAFLQFNDKFEIAFWNTYLFRFHKEDFKKLGRCYEGPGGNFWIKRI